jgi:catechol 2,3-dioxygenase-like lactoylglutathione lyase family enzyme
MPEPLFRKVDCLSVRVPDLDAALAFYSEPLGHELIWRSNTAAGLRLPDSEAELVVHTDNRPMETDLTVPPAAVRRWSASRLPEGPSSKARSRSRLACARSCPTRGATST